MNKNKRDIELLIFIANYLKDKPNYGSTLLNKALYFIDSMSYLKLGSPITDFNYVKLEFGPAPNSKFLALREKLVRDGELEEVETDYFGRRQLRYKATREPEIDVFNKEELQLIYQILEYICDSNASQISDYTHDFISWKFANEREELPMFTFLLTQQEPTSKELEWAKKAIAKHQRKTA